jgi:hypothetical protein
MSKRKPGKKVKPRRVKLFNVPLNTGHIHNLHPTPGFTPTRLVCVGNIHSLDQSVPAKTIDLAKNHVLLSKELPPLSVLWQGIRLQGIEQFYPLKMEPNGYYSSPVTIKMFFSGRRFFFIEHDPVTLTIRMSIIYGSRERANQVYTGGYISWKIKETMNGNP